MAGPPRFDPSSPSSIAGASFSTVRKGYSPDEVRAALTSISSELDRLIERNRQLEAELAHARQASTAAIELDEATLTEKVGEETVRVLQTARESANQIRARAEENAARLVAEAADEVSRMRHDADLEVARKRADAAADAEAEVALAKQQGREMVNEARAYRERVLADLEARTSRARQQLEELAHGRERLLQVFERARLVAIDVATELGKHPGPNELVNLANVTGPVPVMVPAAKPDVGIDDRTVAELAQPDPEPFETTDGALTESEEEVVSTSSTTEDADPVVEPVDTTDSADPVVEPDGTTEATEPVVEPVDSTDSADPVVEPDDTTDSADPEVEPDDSAEPVVEPDDTTDEAEPAVEPVDTAGTTAPPEPEPATGDPEPASRPDNVVALFARLRQEAVDPAPDREASGAVAVLRAPDASPEPEPEAEAVAEASDTPFARRDEALVPLIVTAARKLKRVLADEQNGVLDLLRGRQPVTSLATLLPGADEHAERYISAITDELETAAAAGATEVGGKLSASSSALDAARAHLSGQLVGALRDRLDRSIAAGAGDNADITRGVRNVYREWKTQHIDDQLDDVFRAAFAGGAAVATPAGTPVVWLVEPDQTCCADCADNTLAGAVPAGSEFPTGHTAAPAHPGCGCLVLPE